MKTNEFSLLGTELGLTAYGATLCGVVDGWPLTLWNNNVNHVHLIVDRKRDSALVKQINAVLKTWGGKINSWVGNMLVITAASKKKAQGSASTYIQFCVYALGHAGLHPLETCPYCGGGNCDAAALTGKGYRPVHYRCLQAEAGKAHNKADINRENGSYLLGVLGALIGMLVGTIPTFLTVVYLEMEYSILFALIPICAYFGYKLFSGKMNKAALIVSILMAVLGVFILNFEYIVFSIMREYGFSFSEALSFVPDLLRDGEIWAAIAADSLQEFFFSALGVVIAWGLISRTASGAAANADAALRLAQPYGQRAAAPAADQAGAE